MRKIIAVILINLLIFASFASAETTQSSPVEGDWYTSLNGVPLRLSLKGDGSYERALPAAFGEPVSGTWSFGDGFVRLDDGSALNYLDTGLLIYTKAGLLFTREAPRTYTPPEAIGAAQADWFAGYWKSVYVDVEGTAFPADVWNDRTDLYVEGHSAILGGPALGDVTVKLAEQDGSLATEEGSATAATLCLQQDGLLRLTVTGSGSAPQIWYMARAFSPLLDGEAKPAT